MADSDSNVNDLTSDDLYPEREVLPGVYLTDFRPGRAHDSRQSSSRMVSLDGVDFTTSDSHDTSSGEPQERQLAPGVYMTDFRGTSEIGQQARTTSFGAPVHSAEDQFDHPELADIRVQELINAINHLERSNKELEAMKEEDPDEPLWQETIDENVGVIARKRAEIQRIQADMPIDMTSKR
jgi:hypothetical protein